MLKISIVHVMKQIKSLEVIKKKRNNYEQFLRVVHTLQFMYLSYALVIFVNLFFSFLYFDKVCLRLMALCWIFASHLERD